MIKDYHDILIVEDDRIQRRVIQRTLEALTDANIHIAEDGLEGLQLAKQFKPQVIFCDLRMPNMDGIQFALELASLSIDTHLAFVSTSNSDILDSVVTMTKRQGLSKCVKLNKPISRQDIAQTLDSFLASGEQSPQSIGNIEKEFESEVLQTALTNGEIQPYYQPHLNTENGNICGAEALIRWNHKVHGLLSPNQFLPAINEHGLSYLLCCSVLRCAISQLSQWRKEGFNIRVAVNATPSDLMQKDFADRVVGLLEEFSVPGHALTLEITETEIASNLSRLIEHTTRLRINGVNISIDDFGIGYSSLAQLLSSPFNELKIDQLFISQMLESDRHYSTVEFIIKLAKKLQLSVVAEGVETKEQAVALNTLGCNTLQGYLFSKPMSAQDFSILLKKKYSH